MDTSRLYAHRFSASQNAMRRAYWQVLTDVFFSRYIRSSDTVVDIGAGNLEFLMSIRAKRKIAVDPQLQVGQTKTMISCYPSVHHLPKILRHRVDVVMLSNVLEHLDGPDEVVRMLDTIKNILASHGSLLIIQPVIDLVGAHYWDFLDHRTPLTRSSLQEALALSGYFVQDYVPRFLPYTTKMNIILPPWILRVYLRTPCFLRPYAGQCFIRATPARLP